MAVRRQLPKPILDEKALYEIAVKALARRSRSTAEVRALLAKRQAGQKEIDAVLRRLRENGYLDDVRFARFYVASRLENDRVGPRRVRHDLAARRVHPELIQKTIRTAYQEVDERALLREYIKRKVRIKTVTRKASAVASLYRRLLRAGFASDTIVRELQGLLRGRGRPQGMSRGSSLRARAEIDPEKWQEWVESLADAPEPEAE